MVLFSRRSQLLRSLSLPQHHISFNESCQKEPPGKNVLLKEYLGLLLTSMCPSLQSDFAAVSDTQRHGDLLFPTYVFRGGDTLELLHHPHKHVCCFCQSKLTCTDYQHMRSTLDVTVTHAPSKRVDQLQMVHMPSPVSGFPIVPVGIHRRPSRKCHIVDAVRTCAKPMLCSPVSIPAPHLLHHPLLATLRLPSSTSYSQEQQDVVSMLSHISRVTKPC